MPKKASLEVNGMNAAFSTRNISALLAWLILGSACAVPMQQLVDEALITGDWSEVEQREAASSRRQAREQSMHCGQNEVGYCKASGRLSKRVCTCESFADVRNAFDQAQDPDFE
jgi:hypothetical protein